MLTYPEWLLTIENLTAGWAFDTYEGEEPDPAAAVFLLDDGFRFSWAFRDDLAPNVLEPDTFTFKLSVASPADLPRMRQGDQLRMRLQRPPGEVSRDGSGNLIGAGVTGALDIAWQGFRARTVAAAYHLGSKRVHVTIAATSYMADLNPSVDMTYGSDSWSKYDNARVENSEFGDPMSISAPLVADETTVSAYARRNALGHEDGDVDIRYGGDASSPRELQVLDAVEKWTFGQVKRTWSGLAYDTDHGWAGEDVHVLLIPAVVGERDMYPFTPRSGDVIFWSAKGNYESGMFYLDSWGAMTVLDAAPYELQLVGGDLTAVQVNDPHENTGMMILDAAVVEAAPEWRSTRENAVNQWRFLGQSVDQGADTAVEEFTIRDEGAIARNGPAARTIDTLLVANVYSGSGAYGLNGDQYGPTFQYDGLVQNFRDTVPHTHGDFSPSPLRIVPRLMTDAQWDSYCSRWYPRGKLQQTVALVSVDDDQNLAGPQPLILTLTGCDILLRGGHLSIEPSTRPIRVRTTGADKPATFGDVVTDFPAVTFADIDPDLTFGQLRLTTAP